MVSDSDMYDAVGQGDVSQIETWIRGGLDLAKWRDDIGLNIYHYCANWNTLEALHVAEAVGRLCSTHTRLLTRTTRLGNDSPIIQTCVYCDGQDDSYNMAFMEYFIRQDDTTDFHFLMQNMHNENLLGYIKWRQQNPSGLPESIRRENNGTILKYIDTVESMDRHAAERYRDHMQHMHGISRSIRIYYVGFQGVGKSTLCGNMRGVSIDGLTSTDLMEAFIQGLIVNMRTGQRKNLSDDMGHQLALDKINRGIQHHDPAATKFHQVQRFLFGSKIGQKQKKSAQTSHAPKRDGDSNLYYERRIERQKKKDEKVLACAAEMRMKTADGTHDQHEQDAYVSMWDFGGEEMFVNTNHLFISGDAVYLLVFNLIESRDPNGRMRARITFWLKSIDSLSDKRNSRTPPVILIGTYLDKLPGKDTVERLTQAEAIYRDIVKTPDLKAIVKGHVVKFIPIDNTERNESVIDETWRAVIKAAPYQSHWNTPVPLTWLAVEREIMLRKSQNIKVLNLQEAFDICENLEIEVGDIENCVKDCLVYLHRIGVVIYLVTFASNSTVIIDPVWLVRGFRLIITVPKFQHSSNETRNMLKHYNETGEIPLKLIRLLLGQGQENDNFPEHEDVLVFYMERLELMTRPLTKEGQTVEDTFLVPCILPAAEPEKLRHIIENPATTKTSTLSFVFRDVFMSSPVYDKVLASCIHCFEAAELQGLDQLSCLQRGFGCFQLNPHWNMVIHCADCIVKVTLFAEKKISIKPSEGYHVRYVLTTILNSVLTTNQQPHLVNKFKLCLDKSYRVIPGEQLVSTTDLNKSTKHLPCSGPEGNQTVQKSDLDVWFVDPQMLTETDKISLPFTSAMMDHTLSPRELCHVAKCIGTSYFLFLIEIGLDSSEIQQEDKWRHVCFRTFVTYLLVRWSFKLGQAAIFRVLYQAMRKQGIPTDKLYNELENADDEPKCPTETAGSCGEDVERTQPTEYTVYRRPTEDTVYRRPTEDTVYRRPTEDTVYRRPTEDTVYRRPTEDTVYRRPTEDTVYRRPTEDTVYRRPTEDTVYRSPTEDTVYRRPTEDTVYRRPTEDTVYRSPTEDTVYRRPTEDTIYRRPTEDELEIVVGLMRKTYTIFYLELGLGIEEIEQAVMDYNPLKSAFRVLLKTWTSRFNYRAHLGRIYKAMEEANMDHSKLRQWSNDVGGPGSPYV